MTAFPMGAAAPGVSTTIRPVRPDDRSALIDLYAGMSADSRYARFLRATAGITDGAAQGFCGPDHEHREGLVAEVQGGGEDGRLVGHLCLDPMDDGSFELAVAVADDHRRLGIGRRLLEAAIEWAAAHRIPRLHATMLTTNTAILGLVRSIGLPVALRPADAGVVSADVLIEGPPPVVA